MESSTNTLGKYQIVREIARSNDIIYEAIDPTINRRVALKELFLAPTLDGAQKRERIERFNREAKAAGKLSHPNIVTIYGAGEDNGRYYIAMEYLEGQDLQDVLQVRGALPIQEAVSIALQVCDALSYAHKQGVIHRDIKPDNIQMLSGGVIKITDFGIARLAYEPSITTDGQIFGTPSYMSPEQVVGKKLDHRTDIFSLGVVLYEMLTGRKPFAGDSVVTITYNIMNHTPTPPPGAPPYLSQIINKAMAKDPDMRYSDAADMAEDLRNQTCSGLGLAAPDPFGPGPYTGTGLPPPGGYSPGGYRAPAPSSQPPDPFGGVRPGDIPLPRIPRQPLFSPETRSFLGLAAIALSLTGLLLFAIWMLIFAYQGYREGVLETRAGRYLEYGGKLYDQGDYDGAIRQLRRALDISPKSRTGDAAREKIVSSCIAKGNVEFNAGRFASAETLYRRGLEYHPKSAAAHYAVGKALQAQGTRESVDKAVEEWRIASEVGYGTREARLADEAAAGVYLSRGIEYYNSGRQGEALEAWQKVQELAPGSDAADQAQSWINQAASGG